jgi:Leucine-rich repeat (LRR) protein
MKTLQDLQLGDNFISTIPDEIEQLGLLKILALWDNPIEYYPNSLGSLKNLTVLDFLNNQVNTGTQDRITTMFDSKKTKIYFSPPCACEDGH